MYCKKLYLLNNELVELPFLSQNHNGDVTVNLLLEQCLVHILIKKYPMRKTILVDLLENSICFIK